MLEHDNKTRLLYVVVAVKDATQGALRLYKQAESVQLLLQTIRWSDKAVPNTSNTTNSNSNGNYSLFSNHL